MIQNTGDLAFSALPPAVRSVWAKSGDPVGHGLLAHMLDVAAVAEAVLGAEPPATQRMAAAQLGLTDESARRWIAAMVGLHDLGKATPGFQAKWEPGQEGDVAAGLSFEPTACLACDQHSLATSALLGPLLERTSGAAFVWCQHIAQAVGAHHGYHFTSTEVAAGAPVREPRSWRIVRDDILRAYWEVLTPTNAPSAQELALPIVTWLAGLTSVCDWIASNPAWFPLGERHDSLGAYYQRALALADRALGDVGWNNWTPLLRQEQSSAGELVSLMIGRGGTPARALQLAGDELLRNARGPSLLLVEAPMGEGKTELAFLAHLRLQAANGHRGLYIALPTQATGNALFGRAKTFLRAFASGQLDLQLVHGGAAMSEDLAQLRAVDHSKQEALSSSAWFGQRRRPLLSPYGVGTVDQALYAVLNVKHHFVRLWGLSNRVVVLDEVHAYDTYTGGLIVALLRWLKQLGCSVVLMSATLPRQRTRELLQAWAPVRLDGEVAYPRLMLVDDSGLKCVHTTARPLAPIELLGLSSDISALADLATDKLRSGGCGAVIVNTVKRAQSLFVAVQHRLRAQGEHADVQLLLFHARFPADERQVLEEKVFALFGAGRDRPARALLVATQVAEQSLDIDFDFMISDLAPVDLLLQRAGRLHRHSRDGRPAAHTQARLWVGGLLTGQVPELKQTGWGFVYDPYILGRTWALLCREPVLRLPQDIDRLVQAVYDADHALPEGIEAAVRERIEISDFGTHLAETKAQRMRAYSIAIDPSDEAHRAYDGKPRGHEEDEDGLGLTNSTRLGDASCTLIPVFEDMAGLWRVQTEDAGFDPSKPVDASTARSLYNRQLKVSSRQLVRYFAQQPCPAAFAEHALLRHMRAFRFRSGRSLEPGLNVMLDPELGLVLGDIGQSSGLQGGGP